MHVYMTQCPVDAGRWGAAVPVTAVAAPDTCRPDPSWAAVAKGCPHLHRGVLEGEGLAFLIVAHHRHVLGGGEGRKGEGVQCVVFFCSA